MMKKRVIFTILVAAMCSTYAQASEKMLNQFFQEVNSLKARFQQEVVDEQGMLLEQSVGTFYLSRPGKFRWDYDSLETDIDGQQIIADGDFIYMYSPDLEQVSRRDMQDALAQVPSLVLVQTDSDLKDYFNITDFGLTDGLSWVSLKPKNNDASYQQLMIGFKGEKLSRIELVDGLGNETRLTLSGVDSNAKLSSKTFKFDTPEGADLFIQ